MDGHLGLDAEHLLVGARRDRDVLELLDRHGRREVRALIDPITVQVRAEIQIFAVELLKRGGNGDGKADDLVGDDLPLQVRAGTRAVIDDTGRVATIEAVLRPMIARVGVVEHRDLDALHRLGPRHRGDILEVFGCDLLDGTGRDPARVRPSVPDGVREKLC